MCVFIATAVLFFVVSVISIELVLYALRKHPSTEKRKARKRLRTVIYHEHANATPDILRTRALSTVPAVNAVLARTPGMHRLDGLIRQAHVRSSVTMILLFALLAALAGFIAARVAVGHGPLSIVGAALAGSTPFFYLAVKKKRRMNKFQEQLPEAMELIARALRAGHAFKSGMKLVADQFDDPLGPEFAETLDEINFGLSVSEALENLNRRIHCDDLKFFTVSVIIQREVGGNLAEIIENIARIVRERFQFRDKVRVLSAEGKTSAKILVGLPFVMMFVLYHVNYEYISLLFKEPAGRTMCAVAALMMAAGILVIMRMVRIRV